MKTIKPIEKIKTKKKYRCPFCNKRIDTPPLTIICDCEVEDTGTDEFWKD